MIYKLTRSQKLILRAIAARPNVCTYAHLVHELWGDDPDGGPLNPTNVYRVQISRMKRFLTSKGIVIGALWGEGYTIMQGRDLIESVIAENEALHTYPVGTLTVGKPKSIPLHG